MKTVRKAVFPVAGMGTRFLPATKASPKEMLPVVDKPLIQYAAEEAVAAGIDTLIFITGRNKWAITDHFDTAYELEHELESLGKTRMLEVVRNILPAHVNCVFIRQSQALGLGHAVLCAAPVVGDEPFAVILADDLVAHPTRPCLTQMVEAYGRLQSSVIGVEEVAREEVSSYGVVSGRGIDEGLLQLDGIVEKPAPQDAPSNLAVVGRYILSPRIFSLLETQGRGAGGEIQLTDAIARLLNEERVVAYRFDGKRFDCGSKLGYLQAQVAYALQDDDIAEDLRGYLRSLEL